MKKREEKEEEEEEEEFVREPDNFKRERLVGGDDTLYYGSHLEYNQYDYNYHHDSDNDNGNGEEDSLVRMAIELSLQDILEKTKKRTDSFKDILFHIRRIAKFDKNVAYLSYIVEPIIEKYCAGDLETYSCNFDLFHTIFDSLKLIRTTPEQMVSFQRLFVLQMD